MSPFYRQGKETDKLFKIYNPTQVVDESKHIATIFPITDKRVEVVGEQGLLSCWLKLDNEEQVIIGPSRQVSQGFEIGGMNSLDPVMKVIYSREPLDFK